MPHQDTPRFEARRGPGYGYSPYQQSVYHAQRGSGSFQPRGTFGSIYNRNYQAGQNRYKGTFSPSFGAAGDPLALPLLGTGAGALAIAAWKGFMAYQIIAPLSRGKTPPKWALWWVGTWYLINGVYIGLAGLGLTAAGAAAATTDR